MTEHRTPPEVWTEQGELDWDRISAPEELDPQDLGYGIYKLRQRIAELEQKVRDLGGEP